MNKQDVCKYCKQLPYKCPCAKVDSFFADNWDLMYNWHKQAEYKFAYAVPKGAKSTGGAEKSQPVRKKRAA